MYAFAQPHKGLNAELFFFLCLFSLIQPDKAYLQRSLQFKYLTFNFWSGYSVHAFSHFSNDLKNYLLCKWGLKGGARWDMMVKVVGCNKVLLH